MKMDLILVHLLRIACAPNGPLGDILPQITSELSDLGFVSEHVKDLAIKPSSIFNRTFSHVFGHHMVSSKVSRFWATASDSDEKNSSAVANSRYLNDFVELQPLGHGGYGHVVLCKNKLDGRQYAVKKIPLKEKSLHDRILREVTTLSRLQHQHVVRYYQELLTTMVIQAGDLELLQAPVSASRMEVHQISMGMKMNLSQLTCIFKWNIARGLFGKCLNHIIILIKNLHGICFVKLWKAWHTYMDKGSFIVT